MRRKFYNIVLRALLCDVTSCIAHAHPVMSISVWNWTTRTPSSCCGATTSAGTSQTTSPSNCQWVRRRACTMNLTCITLVQCYSAIGHQQCSFVQTIFFILCKLLGGWVSIWATCTMHLICISLVQCYSAIGNQQCSFVQTIFFILCKILGGWVSVCCYYSLYVATLRVACFHLISCNHVEPLLLNDNVATYPETDVSWTNPLCLTSTAAVTQKQHAQVHC